MSLPGLAFKVGDKVKVIMKGHPCDGVSGDVVITYPGSPVTPSYYAVNLDNGMTMSFYEHDLVAVSKPHSAQDFQIGSCVRAKDLDRYPWADNGLVLGYMWVAGMPCGDYEIKWPNGETAMWSHSALIEVNQANKVKPKGVCDLVHDWTQYVGFTETYEYCRNCDTKRKDYL